MLLCGWKMDVYRVKDRPNKYTWNFLTSQIIAKASLSVCAYPCSVFLSVLEAKAMGCSVPSFTTWEDTAPIPTGDTSQRSLWGRVGSYCVNTCSEVIISFRLWNAVRIVPSISSDGCSLTTALKDVKLLTDWARICCSNWLAPARPSQNCFLFLWRPVETMAGNSVAHSLHSTLVRISSFWSLRSSSSTFGLNAYGISLALRKRAWLPSLRSNFALADVKMPSFFQKYLSTCLA